MFEVEEHTQLSPARTPTNWVETGKSDYHVAVFTTDQPNCLVFAAKYCTIDLIGDCVWSASLEGKQLILSGECSAFEVVEEVNDWPHVLLRWSPNE